MTKLEALAKDCIENHTHRLVDKPTKQDIYTREEFIYISGYKECERQDKNKIADLERKLEQTEKDLIDYQFNYPKIKDLLDKVLRVVHSELHPYQMQPYLEILKQAENFLKE